jgi:hypothetical protein
MLASLFSVLVLVGCGGGDVKLLERMVSNESTVVFEYDNKNRVVTIENYRNSGGSEWLQNKRTIEYSDDGNLITVTTLKQTDNVTSFVVNSNIVTYNRPRAYDGTITLTELGYIGKSEGNSWGSPENKTYKYQDGNLTSMTSVSESFDPEKDAAIMFKIVVKREYDNRKTPLHNSATPKWLLQYLFEGITGTGTFIYNNNVTKYEHIDNYSSSNVTFQYEYDAYGFPTKFTSTGTISEKSTFAYQ